jgi:tRNA-dihydrouridine synthase B
MANFSDSPYRRICRRFGLGLSYSELAPADAILRRQKKFLSLFRFEEEERPVTLQLFGCDPDIVSEAAVVAEEYGADIIDLNMGCSVKEIVHQGAGAGLLRNPALAAQIITAMKKKVRVPVTAKIRTGWDDSARNYREVGRALAGAGVSLISMHGRTKAQAYSGRADWSAIADLKENVDVPVFGSGDVDSHAEALEKVRRFGVDGVLIGRQAMGNPWIFAGSHRDEQTEDQIIQTALDHFEMMMEHTGPLAAVHFRKHMARYFAEPRLEGLRKALFTIEENEELQDALFYARERTPAMS